jgi:hypothetical protein
MAQHGQPPNCNPQQRGKAQGEHTVDSLPPLAHTLRHFAAQSISTVFIAATTTSSSSDGSGKHRPSAVGEGGQEDPTKQKTRPNPPPHRTIDCPVHASSKQAKRKGTPQQAEPHTPTMANHLNPTVHKQQDNMHGPAVYLHTKIPVQLGRMMLMAPGPRPITPAQ